MPLTRNRRRPHSLRSPWAPRVTPSLGQSQRTCRHSPSRLLRRAALHRRGVIRKVALDGREIELTQDGRVRLLLEQEFERAAQQLVHVAAAVPLELAW